MKAKCSYDSKRQIMTLTISSDEASESALLRAFKVAGGTPKMIERVADNMYFYDQIEIELKVGK